MSSMTIPLEWVEAQLGTFLRRGTINAGVELPSDAELQPQLGSRLEDSLVMQEGFARVDIPTTVLRCEPLDSDGFAPALALMSLPKNLHRCMPMYCNGSMIWSLRPIIDKWGVSPAPSDSTQLINPMKMGYVDRTKRTDSAPLGVTSDIAIADSESLSKFLGQVEELKAVIREAIQDIKREER